MSNSIDIFKPYIDCSIFEKDKNSTEYHEDTVYFISELVRNISLDYKMDFNVFYYSTTNENILVVDDKNLNDELLERVCNFCDIHQLILTFENSKLTNILSESGFIENLDFKFDEDIIRYPKIFNISESVMMFSNQTSLLNNNKETNKEGTIQSISYQQSLYADYLKMINSKEYKERRYKESHGVLINRNASKRRGCVPKVGFAIVGQCKVQ
tara:strand:+ start:720 stop:1355 length:636 start_codon:yes stop_codon:yes gene_type:complete